VRRLALVLLATTASVSAEPDPGPPEPVQPAPEDPTARAKQLYTEGKRFYDIGEFAKAVESWKQAYVLSTAPMLLFNIAQAYRLSGDCEQALRFYANYERESSNLTNRTELEQARARCKSQPTGTRPPAPIVTDPTRGGTPPGPEPKATPPPPPSATFVPATTTPTGPVDDRSTARTAGLVTGGTGLVVVGASLALALRARDRAAAVEAYRGEWTTDQDGLQESGRRAATWSVITGIAGALTVVAGGALYVYGSRETRPALDVAIRPHSAEVSWSASF
jgi:tetratricopeptide (TPR) repeat protein